jgi:hypothetical protein
MRNRGRTLEGCLASWQEGFTIRAVSAAVYHDDDRRRQIIHPLFVCLPRCECEQVQEKGYDKVEMVVERPILAEVKSIMAQNLDSRQEIAFTLPL